MKFIVTCPGCSNRTNLEAQNAFGRRAKCKKCNLDFALEQANTREIPDLAAELLRKAEEGEASLDSTQQPFQPATLPSLDSIEQSLNKELNLNSPTRVKQVFPKWMMTVQFAVGIVASVMITLASAVAILRNSQPAIQFTGNQQTWSPESPDVLIPSPTETELAPLEIATFSFNSDVVVSLMKASGGKFLLSVQDGDTRVYKIDGVEAFLVMNDHEGLAQKMAVAISTRKLSADSSSYRFFLDMVFVLVHVCDTKASADAVQFVRKNLELKAVGEKKMFKINKLLCTLVVEPVEGKNFAFFAITPSS